MVKDIYKDDQAVRYKVQCQECTGIFLVYEQFASVPEHIHPGSSSGDPYKQCPGSGRPGSVIEVIPKGKRL